MVEHNSRIATTEQEIIKLSKINALVLPLEMADGKLKKRKNPNVKSKIKVVLCLTFRKHILSSYLTDIIDWLHF